MLARWDRDGLVFTSVRVRVLRRPRHVRSEAAIDIKRCHHDRSEIHPGSSRRLPIGTRVEGPCGRCDRSGPDPLDAERTFRVLNTRRNQPSTAGFDGVEPANQGRRVVLTTLRDPFFQSLGTAISASYAVVTYRIKEATGFGRHSAQQASSAPPSATTASPFSV